MIFSFVLLLRKSQIDIMLICGVIIILLWWVHLSFHKFLKTSSWHQLLDLNSIVNILWIIWYFQLGGLYGCSVHLPIGFCMLFCQPKWPKRVILVRRGPHFLIIIFCLGLEKVVVSLESFALSSLYWFYGRRSLS